MRKPKKVYDDEFKETIRELYNTGKDVTMLSEEYGLPKSTIGVPSGKCGFTTLRNFPDFLI